MGCCQSVSEAEVRILERFGKFDRELHAGLACFCCCTSSVVGTVSLRLQSLDVRVETKTKDNTFCKIKVTVQYQVDPAEVYKSFYALQDPRGQIEAYVHDSIRGTVPGIGLDDLFVSKAKIAKSIMEELNADMASTGYTIKTVLIVDIDPDAKVKAAMNEINAAERNRIATIANAEAAKIARVKEAEAEAESRHLAGQGLANARRAIAEGLQDSVEGFSRIQGVDAHEVMSTILITQYLDTLKEIGTQSGGSTVFLPHSPAGFFDMASQVREGILTASGPRSVHGARTIPGMTGPMPATSLHQ
jgi:regulator of protease activity HflC (stomatin/prohibitin superfamily)